MLLLQKSVAAFEIEGTVGAAETLVDADGAINVYNMKITPDIENDEREGQGSFSQLYSVRGSLGATATFTTEMLGGSTDPLWATELLTACGWVGTTSVYSPVTGAPGGSGGVKTITIGHYEDGRMRSIRGAMGNAVFRMTAGKRILIDWTFRGLWVPPTDASMLTPTYPSTAPLRFLDANMTIGSWEPIISTMTLDLGNEVQLREDANDDVAGYRSAYIASRKPFFSLDPEAALVATKDLYGELLANTQAALAITLGATNNQVVIGAPKVQIRKIDDADRNRLRIDALEFQCNRNAAAGDDELTFTFN